MKKCIKYFLLMFMLFIGINGVSAGNCYYLPGENNKFVVPDGYKASCFYKSSSNNEILKLTMDKTSTTVERVNDTNAITSGTTMVLFNNGFHPTTKFTGTWNGMELSSTKGFSVVEFDKNINGCPKSIYTISNGGSGHIDYVIGFSSSENPTISSGSGATSVIYKLTWTSSGIDVFMEKSDTEQLTYEDEEDNYMYNEAIRNCGTIVKNDQKGSYGEQSGSTAHAVTTETLASCKYYIGLSSNNGECSEVEIRYSLIKETKDGNSTYKIGDTVNSGINYTNLNTALNDANRGVFDGKPTLYDFFTYSNGSWGCPSQIYNWTNAQDAYSTIFGQSQYNDFINDKGANSIRLITPTRDDNCKTEEQRAAERGRDQEGTDVNDCTGLIGPNTLKFLKLVLHMIMIAGPILALVLGTYDLVMAMANGEEDAKKKGIKSMKNRLIAAVLLLVLPYIVELILNIAGKGGSNCL